MHPQIQALGRRLVRVACALGGHALLMAATAFGPFNGPARAQQSQDNSPPGAPAEETSRRLVGVAQEALFVVSVWYEKDKLVEKEPDVCRIQPGFLVGEGLVGITNFSALAPMERKLVRKAEALFAGSDTRYRVQLLDQDSAQDIAVVMLEPMAELKGKAKEAAAGTPSAVAPAPSVRRGLALGSPADPIESAFWTLTIDSTGQVAGCIPFEKGESVTRGGIHVAKKAPGMPVGQKARALAGLPRVDADGRLLGVWSCGLVERELVASGVTVGELEILIRRATNSASAGKLMQARGPGGMMASLSFPSLVTPRAGSTAFASQLCGKLFKALRCSECGGKGDDRWKDDKVRAPGGGWKVTPVRVPCGVCNNSKLCTQKAQWTALRGVASAVTYVRVTPEDSDGVLQALEAAVQEAFMLNPPEFKTRLSASAKSALASSSLVPGRAISFIIPAGEWPSEDVPGWGAPLRAVASADFGLLLLPAPVIKRDIAVGTHVLIVGTVAGFVTSGDGNATVVEQSIIVPLKQ